LIKKQKINVDNLRKNIKHVYIIAGIMSFILYISGVFTGFYIQRSTIEYTEQRIQSLQRRLENIQLEYMYLSTMGKEVSCDFLSVLVDEATKDVWDIGKQLVSLENEKAEPERVAQLTSDYSLVSVRAWILNSYVSQRCKEDKVVILYFYSVPCSDCIKQGKILDELREEVFRDKMRVFVLNVNSKESIVQDLMKTYDVVKTPSIVVGNSSYVGLMNKDKLEDIISDYLS
jgi:thiol-disulfide isomerase/thioredoxin